MNGLGNIPNFEYRNWRIRESRKEFSENLEINGELKKNDYRTIITKPFWWCHSGKFQKILEFITVIFHIKGFWYIHVFSLYIVKLIWLIFFNETKTSFILDG